jgi:hypothetical protein
MLLVALSWIGLKPLYARFLVIDREPWGAMLSGFPDRKAPGYVGLVRQAADTIPRGEAVAVLFPTLDWHRGYSYAYFRAQYFLPGRKLVPLGWPDGARPDRLSEAGWAIVFGVSPPEDGWTVVATSPDGAIMRRSR